MVEGAEFGVIFDMDGVLIDSYAAHLQTWQDCCRRHGRECFPTETKALFLVRRGRGPGRRRHPWDSLIFLKPPSRKVIGLNVGCSALGGDVSRSRQDRLTCSQRLLAWRK